MDGAMNIVKLEVLVLDMDGIGEDAIKSTIENTKYPNYCISPIVRTMVTKEVGEWYDDHPLNKKDSFDAEVVKIFGI
jgi:hypothetical protein